MKTSDPQLTLRDRIVGLCLFAGVCVALLSAFENRVPWIAAFCGHWGDGCRSTAHYRFLGLPVAPLGMLYYALLGLLYLRRRSWLFGGVMVGAGFEAMLLGVMIEEQFFCVFCAANALLMALLWLCHFDRKRPWEMAALLLLAFVFGGALLSEAPTGKQTRNRERPAEAVLARVGAREIAEGEIERPLTSEIYKAQKRIYEMKSAVLENRIDDLLLEQDAREKGLSFDALVAGIREKVPEPANHVVDHYYATGLYRKWGSWAGTEQAVKAKIREYLHTRESDPLVLDYCRQLRQKQQVEIFLKAPPLPSTRVRIEGAPALGPTNALVTVVEFSDYLCPVCRSGHETVRRIREKYKTNVRWVFKDNPLDRHPGAKELALAAHCADAQGKFWEYQEALFSGDKKPTGQDALAYAAQLGLDTARFRECLADPALVEDLERSIAETEEAGINSTPTFLINGRLRIGVPSFEEFSGLIDRALEEAEKETRKSLAPKIE